MAVTPQNVKDVAQELASETDARLNLFIGFAENSVNRDYFKTNADLAVILMAAHMLTVANAKGKSSGGNIKSESVGQMSRSYGDVKTSSSDDGNLDASSYGRWFRQLRNQYVRTPILA